MKVVINDCHGGFGLSQKALDFLGIESEYDISRDDPELIKYVETLKEEANGNCAKLKIIEIPDDVEYVIEEYDGAEWIAEKHRTWGLD